MVQSTQTVCMWNDYYDCDSAKPLISELLSPVANHTNGPTSVWGFLAAFTQAAQFWYFLTNHIRSFPETIWLVKRLISVSKCSRFCVCLVACSGFCTIILNILLSWNLNLPASPLSEHYVVTVSYITRKTFEQMGSPACVTEPPVSSKWCPDVPSVWVTSVCVCVCACTRPAEGHVLPFVTVMSADIVRRR